MIVSKEYERCFLSSKIETAFKQRSCNQNDMLLCAWWLLSLVQAIVSDFKLEATQ